MNTSKLTQLYPDLLMAYESEDKIGVWLPPLQFYILNKDDLSVIEKLSLSEATEFIKNSTPLFEVDDSDKPTDEIIECI